jgi:hypothetical protein
VLDALPRSTAAVIMTTWAFAYLDQEDRATFVEILDRASHDRALAWLSAEGAGTVEPFAGLAHPEGEKGMADILGAVLFTNGVRHAHLLGYVQEHGAWLDWRAT